MEKEFLYKDETYKIIGACFNVYNELGSGFLEAVYQEALEYELHKQKISFQAQVQLDIYYDGKVLRQKYIPDFICHDKIILEIKACKNLDDQHRSQTYNYLKATKLTIGYLINFGAEKELEYERIIQSN